MLLTDARTHAHSLHVKYIYRYRQSAGKYANSWFDK